MDLLISLVILFIGFMVFGSLHYKVSPFLSKKNTDSARARSISDHSPHGLKVNKTRNTYYFKR